MWFEILSLDLTRLLNLINTMAIDNMTTHSIVGPKSLKVWLSHFSAATVYQKFLTQREYNNTQVLQRIRNTIPDVQGISCHSIGLVLLA